jgi:hypothetical protein
MWNETTDLLTKAHLKCHSERVVLRLGPGTARASLKSRVDGILRQDCKRGFCTFCRFPPGCRSTFLDIEVDVELLASLAGTRHGSPASILR